MSGAVYPCKICGMSARNSVHQNIQQYDHHRFVDPPEEVIVEETVSISDEDVERIAKKVVEMLDDQKLNQAKYLFGLPPYNTHEFCLFCGAGIGKFRRDGEGTCEKCDKQ